MDVDSDLFSSDGFHIYSFWTSFDMDEIFHEGKEKEAVTKPAHVFFSISFTFFLYSIKL